MISAFAMAVNFFVAGWIIEDSPILGWVNVGFGILNLGLVAVALKS